MSANHKSYRTPGILADLEEGTVLSGNEIRKVKDTKTVDFLLGEWVKLEQEKQDGGIFSDGNGINKTVESGKHAMYIGTLDGSVWLEI